MAQPGFRLPAFEDRDGDPPRPRRRAVVIGIAATVTVAGLGSALYLGTLGYDVRRNDMHDARLKGILVQTPTVYQVTEGLKEKAPLVQIVENEEQLQLAIAKWGGVKADEIRIKAGEWPQLRVFEAGDMMYFIYFDAGNIMRDYIYVSM